MEKYSNLEETRLKKIDQIRKNGIEPYPNQAARTISNREAVEMFEETERSGDQEAVQVTLVGRLRSVRPMGKITFAHIEDGSGRIQLFFRANDIGQDKLEFFNQYFDLGDFIQASGELFRTRTEEVTLKVESFTMLAKAVTPLPPAKDEIVDGESCDNAPDTTDGDVAQLGEHRFCKAGVVGSSPIVSTCTFVHARMASFFSGKARPLHFLFRP